MLFYKHALFFLPISVDKSRVALTNGQQRQLPVPCTRGTPTAQGPPPPRIGEAGLRAAVAFTHLTYGMRAAPCLDPG